MADCVENMIKGWQKNYEYHIQFLLKLYLISAPKAP